MDGFVTAAVKCEVVFIGVESQESDGNFSGA